MYRKSLLSWLKHLDFILIDLVCLYLAFFLASFIRYGTNVQPGNQGELKVFLFLLSVSELVVVITLEPFHDVFKRGYYKEFAAILKQALAIFAIITISLFVIKDSAQYSRIVVALTIVSYALIGYGVRLLYKQVLRRKVQPKRSLLLVTISEAAKYIIQETSSPQEFIISGLILLDADLVGMQIEGVPVVASSANLVDYVSRHWVDEVLIHAPEQLSSVQDIMNNLLTMGTVVHVSVNKTPVSDYRKQFVEKIGECAVLTTSINSMTLREYILKRSIDIIGSAVGLVLTAFACLFIAPFLLKESPGPLFFTQVRVGKNGKKFKIYKIRSMYLDAEERKKELLAQNRIESGMMFKLDWDPRIIGNRVLPDGTKKTGIGQFIRKTSLDELPQFLNVLKGDMSLVGTRPPTVDEWEKYKPHHHMRLAIRPGMTGMWQVNGRSEIMDFEEVVRLDEEYITNWSMGLDFRILLKTLLVVFRRKGAL